MQTCARKTCTNSDILNVPDPTLTPRQFVLHGIVLLTDLGLDC